MSHQGVVVGCGVDGLLLVEGLVRDVHTVVVWHVAVQSLMVHDVGRGNRVRWRKAIH